MKKFFTILSLFLTLSVNADTLKVMAFSDPHVLHESLFSSDSATAAATFASGLMLTEYSQKLFDEAIRVVEDSMPDVLLVPGDLALNGDSVSLHYVAGKLGELQASGVRVQVIAGNHDIDEPGAKSYVSGVRTRSLTKAEFLELFGAFGYDDAEVLAPDSLSYMSYLGDSLALIALNSCLDNRGGHKSAGGLTEAVLSWAETQAAKAIADGRYPVAMMHHQILEHFDNQLMIDNSHVANVDSLALGGLGLGAVQARLANAGINIVFTGHMHIHSTKDILPSVQAGNTNNRRLYDVSTNCLSGYGASIRTLCIANGGIVSASASELGDIVGLSYSQRQTLALQRMGNMANSAFNKITTLLKSQLGATGETLAAQMNPLIDQYMRADYTQLFGNLSRGDEYVNDGSSQAFAQQCANDFTNVKNSLNLSSFGFLDQMMIAIALPVGETILNTMVNSIMANTKDFDSWTSAGVNRVHDSDPVIAAQYKIAVKPVAVPSTQQDGSAVVAKSLRHGHLLIHRSGRTYTALGAEVRP